MRRAERGQKGPRDQVGCGEIDREQSLPCAGIAVRDWTERREPARGADERAQLVSLLCANASCERRDLVRVGEIATVGRGAMSGVDEWGRSCLRDLQPAVYEYEPRSTLRENACNYLSHLTFMSYSSE
jgi:hypothetical protein